MDRTVRGTRSVEREPGAFARPALARAAVGVRTTEMVALSVNVNSLTHAYNIRHVGKESSHDDGGGLAADG